MEYSPECAIPYLSRVDAGTAEAVRRRGVEIVSSGDLVQRFEAAWTPAQLETHRAASEALYRIKDRAFAAAAEAVRGGRSLTEYDLQQQMVRLVRGGRARQRLGAGGRGRRQRRQPALPAHGRALSADNSRTRCCCSISGASMTTPGAVFADITWVGFTGPRGARRGRARRFAPRPVRATRRSRSCRRRHASGRELRGWEVDRAARTVLEQAGYGDARSCTAPDTASARASTATACTSTTTKRTTTGGSSPARDSPSSPDSTSTTFGVRTEINMYRGERDALVTGPRQAEIVTLT